MVVYIWQNYHSQVMFHLSLFLPIIQREDKLRSGAELLSAENGGVVNTESSSYLLTYWQSMH